MSHARWLSTLFLAGAGLLFAHRAEATHYFGSTMHYRIPDPVGAPKKIEVVLDYGTRPGAGPPDPITIDFGDGTTTLASGYPIASAVLTGPGPGAYQMHRFVVAHTYPSKASYSPWFTNCCAVSNVLNGNDASYGARITVDLSPGNTGSAIASVPPRVHLQTGGLRTHRIAARDPDGAPLTCRFATQNESFLTESAPSIPGGAAPTIANDPTGCLLSWDTAGGLAGQAYYVAIAMETSNGAQKSIAVTRFIVELTAAPPPTCDGTGLFDAELGQTLSLPFVGTGVAGGDLELGSIGLVGALSPPDGSAGPSPLSAQWSFSPLPGDEGLRAMNIVYRDTQGHNGDCSAVVTVAPCPSFGMPCAVGVGACAATGSLHCSGGQVLCSAVAAQPSAETCNGLDDDCNGIVDEGDPGSGQLCSTGLPGPCDAGTTACSAGATACIPKVLPGTTADTCNGVDDDCDGTVDSGFDVGTICTAGVGACAASGVVICDGMAGATCNAVAGTPAAEICGNETDDDCNGVVDDGCGQAGTGGAGGGTGGHGGAGGAGGHGGAGGETGGHGGVGETASQSGVGGETGSQGGAGGETASQGAGAAGGDATSGATTSGATGGGAGSDPPVVNGCACTAGGAPEKGAPLAAVALLGLALWRRRQRAS